MTIDVDYRFADIDDLPKLDGVERVGAMLLASLIRLDDVIIGHAFDDGAYAHVDDVGMAVDARAIIVCRLILHKPEIYDRISN